MSPPGRFQPAYWVLIAALGAAGLLVAQRKYRGVPFPPELDLTEPPPGGDRPGEFYFARLAYSDPYGMRIEGDRPWMIDSPAAERCEKASVIAMRWIKNYTEFNYRSLGSYTRADLEAIAADEDAF